MFESVDSVSQLTIQIEYFEVQWYLTPVTESCLRIPKDFVGRKSTPTDVPHHSPHPARPSPYSRMRENASNQSLTMLESFNEQSMSLLDGVEWLEMRL